jgi:hypothetical protein
MGAKVCEFVPWSESDNLDELSDYFWFCTRKCFVSDGRKMSLVSQVSDFRVSGFAVRLDSEKNSPLCVKTELFFFVGNRHVTVLQGCNESARLSAHSRGTGSHLFPVSVFEPDLSSRLVQEG